MRTIVKNIDKTIKHLNFEVMDIHQHPADENRKIFYVIK